MNIKNNLFAGFVSSGLMALALLILGAMAFVARALTTAHNPLKMEPGS
jgi:hypothetical protein